MDYLIHFKILNFVTIRGCRLRKLCGGDSLLVAGAFFPQKSHGDASDVIWESWISPTEISRIDFEITNTKTTRADCNKNAAKSWNIRPI